MVRASEGVVRVGGLAEVFDATNRVVVCLEREGADPEELLILRLHHGIYAIVNRCPHLARTLDDGRIHGHVLTCPGHGRSYNVRSGRLAGTLPGSGQRRLRRVPAWTDRGQLFIDITGI